MTDNVRPIKPKTLGEAVAEQQKDDYDYMQAQLKAAGESVKPASHVLYRVLELVEQYGSEELKEKINQEVTKCQVTNQP